MDGLGAGRSAGLYDLVDQEVGLRGGWRPDVDGLVGHLDMERITIGVRIDGHRLDAHLPRGLDDAASDLTAVGNKDFLEHCRIGPCWPGVLEGRAGRLRCLPF